MLIRFGRVVWTVFIGWDHLVMTFFMFTIMLVGAGIMCQVDSFERLHLVVQSPSSLIVIATMFILCWLGGHIFEDAPRGRVVSPLHSREQSQGRGGVSKGKAGDD